MNISLELPSLVARVYETNSICFILDMGNDGETWYRTDSDGIRHFDELRFLITSEELQDCIEECSPDIAPSTQDLIDQWTYSDLVRLQMEKKLLSKIINAQGTKISRLQGVSNSLRIQLDCVASNIERLEEKLFDLDDSSPEQENMGWYPAKDYQSR